MKIEKLIKELSYYSFYHLGIDELDRLYIENTLLNRFGCTHPYEETINHTRIQLMEVPDTLIEELYKYKGEKDERFATEIFGLLTPAPSTVIRNFYELRKSDNPQDALKYLYNLQIKNNYIRKTSIDKNIHWEYKLKDNTIEIAINLSKPENNNKDIAKLLAVNTQEKKYPECLLCMENLGFGGTQTHPARQNIRIIPMKLNSESFFMQYSPYSYYNEHVIIINEEHSPMHICEATFQRLCDFVDIIPEYFIGSNSDLPIVGGSILNHEHYQGGSHIMPLMKASDRFVVIDTPKLKVSYLNWFNSCIKIESSCKQTLVLCMEKIKEAWYSYDNEEINIISNKDNIRHNAITPIVRKQNDKYIGYIILRNNRCDENFPEGIFHAHPEFHNIKKEGIGLIEAMGLFILPGRLKRQCQEIESILIKKEMIDLEQYFLDHEDMRIHEKFIQDIIKESGVDLTSEKAKEVISNKINKSCKAILENTAVFKNNTFGNQFALEFLNSIDF